MILLVLQHAPVADLRQLTVRPGNAAVDNHMLDARGVLPGAFKSGVVLDLIEVEQGNVGIVTLFEQTSLVDLVNLSWQ